MRYICFIWFMAGLCFGDDFGLSSSSIKNGAAIGNNYVYTGCHGLNQSPELEWKNPPKGTKSFALSMFDPDVQGNGWWHWVVFNIPLTTSDLKAGASNNPKLMPVGAIEGYNDFGTVGYGGPCPPVGKPHRYIFTVYALKVTSIDTGGNIYPADLGKYLQSNSLAKVSIIAKYGRAK